MEDELKCPYCNNFFCNPLLLPCFHSICYTCALNLQEKLDTEVNNSSFKALRDIKQLLTQTNKTNNSGRETTIISNVNVSATKSDALTNASSATSPTSSACSTQSFSPVNIDQLCRSLSINDLGSSSIVSDLDKLSMLSETDSGIALLNNNNCNSKSRPCSYLSNESNYLNQSINSQIYKQQNFNNSKDTSSISFNTSLIYSTFLPCPQCNRMIYMDETGVDSLTKNNCLENIVENYTESKKLSIKCQMCPAIAERERDAVFMCEQCEIFYCDQCRESYHPLRGPLQKHKLITPKLGRDIVRKNKALRESKCSNHLNENVNFYCSVCKCACCDLCVTDLDHINHQMQQLTSLSKLQKAELTQILKSLSEKAKSATEFVTKLRALSDKIEDNALKVKSMLVTDIDQIIKLLETKKRELVDYIEIQKSSKIKESKDQISYLSNKVQKTTGLLQFCVETLKEQDPNSFLQISENLINRVSDIDKQFPKELMIDIDFDFKLYTESVYKEIKKLSFKQFDIPSPPNFIEEECLRYSTESLLILSWSSVSNKNDQTYVLEIDDGTYESVFKEVYCGSNTICKINGISPHLIYNARVKAFNKTGSSDFSPIITLSTNSIWFTFNPKTSHKNSIFSDNYLAVTSLSLEDIVILGSTGFSKGIHYWELTIQRYENGPGPCFGVARYDIPKDNILGKDSKSWGMYIDSKRCWLMHNGKHLNKTEKGIQQGSVIGVLLDLNKNTLSYFVNNWKSGITFSSLPSGTYFPAFSLNKNVQISLNSGLEPPNNS